MPNPLKLLAAMLLALVAQTASAGPVEPDPEPVIFVVVQTPHGERHFVILRTPTSRNRFYSPDTGRFISSDPLGMVNGPNTYGFCGGDPVNRSDPMGTTWYAAEAGGYVWRQEGGDGPNPTQADWDRLADITGHEGAFVGSSYMVPNANGYLRSNGEFIYFSSESDQVRYEGRVMGHNQALGDLRQSQRVAAARAKAGERTTWTVYANGRAVRSGVSADGYSAALRSELEREEVWGDFHPGLRDYPGFNAIGRAVADQSNAAMSAYKEGMTEVAIAIVTDKGLGLLFKGAKWGYSALTKVDDLAREGRALRRGVQVAEDAGVMRRYRPSGTPDASLPAGTGMTDKYGNYRWSTQGSSTEQALARTHEQVHSFLSPKADLLRTFRADLRMTGYQRSSFLRYVEEATSETVAQMRVNGVSAQSLVEGIRFPVANGYVTLGRVVGEGAVGTVAIGGTAYGVYVWSSEASR